MVTYSGISDRGAKSLRSDRKVFGGFTTEAGIVVFALRQKRAYSIQDGEQQGAGDLGHPSSSQLGDLTYMWLDRLISELFADLPECRRGDICSFGAAKIPVISCYVITTG